MHLCMPPWKPLFKISTVQSNFIQLLIVVCNNQCYPFLSQTGNNSGCVSESPLSPNHSFRWHHAACCTLCHKTVAVQTHLSRGCICLCCMLPSSRHPLLAMRVGFFSSVPLLFALYHLLYSMRRSLWAPTCLILEGNVQNKCIKAVPSAWDPLLGRIGKKRLAVIRWI